MSDDIFYQRIPIIGQFLKSDSRLDIYTPAAIEKINNEQSKYRTTIGVGKDILINEKSFEIYNKASDQAKQVLEASIHQKLVAAGYKADKAKKVANEIISKLAPSEALITAQKNHAEFIKTFQKHIEEIPQTRNAKSLIESMTKEVINAGKAIKNQQQLEKANVENLELPKDVTLDITDALDNFEKAQKQNLENFDKSTVADLVKMHSASAKENNRQLFIKNLYENNAVMKKEIDALIDANKAKNPNSIVRFDQYDDKIDISDISLDDLKSIKSLDYWGSVGKGREIIKNEHDGSYKLSFTRRIWSPLYYLDPRQNVLADLTLLAQTVKAQGHNSIEMRVTFDDEKLALERGRQSYEACIRSGFEPKNINLIINGQEYTHNPDPKSKSQQSIRTVLYKDKGSEYSNLTELSKNTIGGLSKIQPPAKSSAEIKKEIVAEREKEIEKEKAAAQKQDAKEEPEIVKNNNLGS